MQAGDELNEGVVYKLEKEWLDARDSAVKHADMLHENKLHKQLVNRITEPWMWITVIATTYDAGWENFFHLRCDPMAEPHIQKIAYMARDLYDESEPRQLDFLDWHLPLIMEDGDHAERIKLSVGRCARVSYLTHEGTRDLEADLTLHDRLAASGHWSPFEHVACNCPPKKISNLGVDWYQYRKEFQNECVGKAAR